MTSFLPSFLLLTVGLLPIFSSAIECSTIPPHLWCSHKDIISSCNLTNLCSKYINATLNKPIQLKVLIESLCPDTENWIINHLYPQVYKNFADFVTVEFVPYGNAKVQDGGIVCQHGEDECRINMFESCLIDATQDQKQYVPMIYCLEKQLKNGTAFEDASSKCFETLEIGFDIQRLVQSCLVSRLGKQLQAKAGERTANVWPEQHKHVPWILFNNVSLSSAQLLKDDIPTLICQWYEGDKQIPYCRQQQKLLKRKSSNWSYFLQDFF
ncbi:unnamed protein product [Auanema sp. JU1783]|nr:unnamed protein product [Auanema sp. JU1783]